MSEFTIVQSLRELLAFLGLRLDDFAYVREPDGRPDRRVIYVSHGIADDRLDRAAARAKNVKYNGLFVAVTRTLAALLLSVSCMAQTDAELRTLFDAVVQVESGGNASARGERGERGVAQITPIMLADVNRITGSRLALRDVLGREGAWYCFRSFARHYSAGASLETIARRWNGGPTGDRKRATAGYWTRVRRLLG